MSKQIAIITGASSGLGKAYAIAIDQTKQYDEIWVIARRKEKLEELQKYCQTPIVSIPLDLTDTQSFYHLEKLLSNEKPQVGLFIANAGFGLIKESKDMSIQEVSQMIDLNCKAAVTCTNLVIPYMTKGSGILEIASVASFQPLPGFNLYASTKSFLRYYTYGLHTELKKDGIHVTCVCPYWISDTEFIGRAQNTPSKDYQNVILPSTTKEVVSASLKALQKNKVLCTPGILSSTQAFLTSVLPISTVTNFMNVYRKK